MKSKKQKCFDVELSDNAIFDDELIIPIKAKQKSQDIKTPMQNQYLDIKKSYPNDLVLFQRGNFFQAYEEDAHLVRKYIDVQWKVPDHLIGLNELSLIEHLLTLVMQINKRIVVCEQSTFQKNANLFDRFVTGIYTKGLLGFGMLGDCGLEQNFLVSLCKTEAIVLDSINKVAYYTDRDNLDQIQISEIITNEQYRTTGFINKGRGKDAFEQLENYFNERCIDGMSQITFIDDSRQDFQRNQHQQQFCLVTDNAIQQMFFKPLFHPVTKEGKRKLLILLRKIPIHNIEDSQQTNKDLQAFKDYRDGFQQELKQIGSLQYQMARVFNSPKNQLVLKKFLFDIKYILQQLKSKIYINKYGYKSKRLLNLIEYNDYQLQEIMNSFMWEGEEDILTPKNEERAEYLKILSILEDIQEAAGKEFTKIKKDFYNNDTKVTFSNFEIEMPEHYQACKDLLFSNRRKGYRKYTDTILQKLQLKHIQIMDQLKVYLQLFYNKVIDSVKAKRQYFADIIEQLSFLDVQIALSKYLENEEFKCTPEICSEQQIELVDFRHPLIGDCIPNSVAIRDCVIITGYNGAGKSTILRSVGLLVILASLGCQVPCGQMRFRPFNEIHSRMGAYDSIRESTFYIELKEVRAMMDKQNCLFLIDELGRGTSSVDGHALAYGILKYLLKQQSMIMFTTHFDITLCEKIYYMEDFHLKQGQVIENLTSRILK